MHSRLIEKAVAKLQCGSKTGTAFLISPQILLTALHTIDRHFSDGSEIIVEFLNIGETKVVKKAVPITGPEFGVDVVALRLEEAFDDNLSPLKIVNSQIPYNIEWSTFGYSVEFPLGGKLEGKVLRVNEAFNPFNWNIDLSHTSVIENCEGLSGAPLLIDGTIKGVLIYQANRVIGAIGISKFTNLLDSIGVQYENSFGKDSLPGGLEERAAESIPNYQVFELLENAVRAKNQGYIILTGTPGSGKTIVSATFTPVSEDIEIIGRYFLRIPEDNISISYRASSLVFAKWMENQVARILYGTVAEEKDYDYHTYIKRISQGLHELSSHIRQSGKIGVIFIDGIDDAVRSGIQEVHKLLGLLPHTLPQNIAIVLSAKPELVPTEILQTISHEYRIAVTPLTIETCRSLISKHLHNLNLSYEQLNSLAEKTNGHPLYINYIVKFLADKSQEFVKKYIGDLPIFSGEIESYYENIWSEVCTNEHGVWIVSTICRLRNEIDKSSLIKMMPEHTANSFPVFFDKVKHLFKGIDCISIFHFSFAEFIIAKTEYQSAVIHDSISKFCSTNADHEYSLRNIIYHLVNGSNDDLCISVCNQEWADQCSSHFIEPDIVVSDIKLVLVKAMEKGNLVETVRLLLLSQRIVFRNNNILAKFAFEIAKLLIIIGAADKALKYILRESMLLVSTTEALYLLRELYHHDAIDEGNILHEAIDARIYYAFEQQQITIDLLSLLVQNTLLYDLNNKLNSRYIAHIYHTINENLKDSNYSSEREQIMNQLIAFQTGYILWQYGEYTPLDEMVEKGYPLSKSTSELLAFAITEYKQQESLNREFKNQGNIAPLINDLEKVITEYGIDSKRLAAFALYEDSNNFELVEKLISDSDLPEDITTIRKRNGVDLNWEMIYRWMTISKLKGYISYDLPGVSCDRDQWEIHFISMAKYISYSYGRACRLRAEGRAAELNELIEKVIVCIKDSLTFDLADRIEWDRSYGIPEEFIPVIYEDFILFILEFDAPKCSEVVQYVQRYANSQLGLYTEGYREVLFKVAEAILKSKDHFRKSFPILKQLEEHIDIGVLNRWERSVALLRLSELYSVLGNRDKAKLVFLKMLETSMGPSWYKEDQLSIMADSLICLGNKLPEEGHLPKIAGLLQAADGEMTFQRYIRTEKENLLGAMFKFGHYDKALRYFRELTFPDLNNLIMRAESFGIDSSKPGEGYINGTREINEQSAILSMLDHCEKLDVLIKWALTEIFFLGDSRYNDQFIKHQVNLLNSSFGTDVNQQEIHDLIVSRIVRMIVCDFDIELRNCYLSELQKLLNSQSYLAISKAITRLGFSLPDATLEEHDTLSTIKQNAPKSDDGADEDSEDENHRIFFPGTFGTRKAMRTSNLLLEQAKAELEIENHVEVRKILVSALHITQEGGWNIWGRPSNTTNDCFKLLANSVDNEKQLLQLLTPLVTEEVYAEYWVIVLKLLKLTEKFLSKEQSQNCMTETIKHIELLVRPKQEVLLQFEWLSNSDTVNEELDELMIDFLVWLMNYPDRLVRDKAIEVLSWLAEVRMEKVVPRLVKASLAERTGDSSEIAAGILHGASRKRISCWRYIQEYQAQILSSPSFQIKSTYYEITKQLSSIERDAESFKQQLKLALFSTEKPKIACEDLMPPFFISPINKQLKKLGSTQVLSAEVFARTNENISIVSGGLGFDRIKVAEKYLERSYSKKQNLLSNIVRQAFVRSLEGYIIEPEYQQISDVLRIYNPFFPDTQLSTDEIDDIHKAIRGLFNNEIQWADRCSNHNDKAYLHYFERIYNDEAKTIDFFEIVSYFVKREEFKKNKFLDVQYEVFNSSSIPNLNLGFDLSASSLPAIIKVSPSNVFYGGNFTPAFPHPFLSYLGFKEEDFSRRVWRIGRNLSLERFGMPQREGCSLMVRKSLINSYPKYKLVRLVKYNEDCMLIDPEEGQIFSFD